jgi:hypothetical protein
VKFWKLDILAALGATPYGQVRDLPIQGDEEKSMSTSPRYLRRNQQENNALAWLLSEGRRLVSFGMVVLLKRRYQLDKQISDKSSLQQRGIISLRPLSCLAFMSPHQMVSGVCQSDLCARHYGDTCSPSQELLSKKTHYVLADPEQTGSPVLYERLSETNLLVLALDSPGFDLP